jgi:acetyl esterase/lipase
MPAARSRLEQLASRGTAIISSTFFRALSGAARLHPLSRPEAHGVQVLRDLPYRIGHGAHREYHLLDVYRPVSRPGPWPVVFYVHGGAFSILSKDTHWLMGLVFARFGYMVVNISYRLAPRHPFPAAIEDVCAAWQWLAEHGAAYGGDLRRVAVAGESAGGNLVTALTLATCQRRREPWAQAAWETGLVPSATLPFCALLEVSRPERFAARRRLPFYVAGALRRTSRSYLQRDDHGATIDLADPLVVLERGAAAGFDRPLPAFFVPVGTRDPLLDDTRRLEKALAALNVPCEARYYPGGVHAFHALVWDPAARRCWRDALAFLDRHLRAGHDRFAVAAAAAG